MTPGQKLCPNDLNSGFCFELGRPAPSHYRLCGCLAPGPELLAQVLPDCYPDGLGHWVDLNDEALATNVDGLFGHCA